MAYDFTGSGNDYLNFGSILDVTSNISVACTFKMASGSVAQYMVSKWSTDSNSRCWLFGVNTSDQLQAYVSTDGTFEAAYQAAGSTTLSVGTWYHAELVIDTSNTDIVLYLNGAQDGIDSTGPSSINATGAERKFYIGGTRSSSSPFVVSPFDGVIQEVAHWDSAHTAAEAAALGKNIIPTFLPGSLTFYAPLSNHYEEIVGEHTRIASASYPTIADHHPVANPMVTYVRGVAASATTGGFSVIDRYYRQMMAA